MQGAYQSLKYLLYLVQGGLFVIEGVQEAEYQRGCGMYSAEEFRKFACNGLFHLVTGEPARNEDTAEKFTGIDFSCAGKAGQCMHVEAVAPVDHRYRFFLCHCMRGHLKRELKNGTVAIQQKNLSRFLREGMYHSVRTYRCCTGIRIRNHRETAVSPLPCFFLHYVRHILC
jgi:hypothetical protein